MSDQLYNFTPDRLNIRKSFANGFFERVRGREKKIFSLTLLSREIRVRVGSVKRGEGGKFTREETRAGDTKFRRDVPECRRGKEDLVVDTSSVKTNRRRG